MYILVNIGNVMQVLYICILHTYIHTCINITQHLYLIYIGKMNVLFNF